MLDLFITYVNNIKRYEEINDFKNFANSLGLIVDVDEKNCGAAFYEHFYF